MLTESCVVPTSESSVGGLSLHCIWTVSADPSYDVPAHKAIRDSAHTDHGGGRSLIAFRTIHGQGQFELRSNRMLEVSGDTVVLTDWSSLVRYRCVGDAWNFWWFDFAVSNPLDFNYDQVFNIPIQDEERALYESILKNLRASDNAGRSLACAQFQMLLCQWRREQCESVAGNRHNHLVQSVISEMHARLDGTFTVSEMSAMVDLSESHFRRLFQTIMGTTPKKHYDQLRLVWADHNLKIGRMNVTEVSNALGFFSPFHFSRIYRQHYGFPPSKRKPSNHFIERMS